MIATPNLNGDYLSDAVCGSKSAGSELRRAATSALGRAEAVFEATHGTAPKYADQDKVNPARPSLYCAMTIRLYRFERGRPAESHRRGYERTSR